MVVEFTGQGLVKGTDRVLDLINFFLCNLSMHTEKGWM